jgi:hypothetical protein
MRIVSYGIVDLPRLTAKFCTEYIDPDGPEPPRERGGSVAVIQIQTIRKAQEKTMGTDSANREDWAVVVLPYLND